MRVGHHCREVDLGEAAEILPPLTERLSLADLVTVP
jgi:hypothetical protein